MERKPVLWVVVPCYNEEAVLPVTAPLFAQKLGELAAAGKIDGEKSRVLFVDDGSKDRTWEIIRSLSEQPVFCGVAQSRNRGHQNALLCGLMEAKDRCDLTISIDCDGQDDLNAMDRMVDAYLDGCDVVYGVRSSRKSDTVFKRGTAQGFYKLLRALGAETVYNHADYRLLSNRALQALAEYREVNLYLRGMVPMLGFKSTAVEYERTERLAGKSHYPLRKMLSLALNGITNLSVKPLRLIGGFGFLVSILAFAGVIWALIAHLVGSSVAGWASTTCILCFVSGVQTIFLGVVGEYVGKIYLEVKARPRYWVAERTGNLTEEKPE